MRRDEPLGEPKIIFRNRGRGGPRERGDSPKEKFAPLKDWALLGGACFGALALLSPTRGSWRDLLVFLPLYLLCAAQCYLQFRNKLWNAALGLVCLLHVLYGALGDLRTFDYSFLILMLNVLSLWAAGREGKGHKIALGAVMLAFAALSLVWVRTGTRYYAYAAGASAIPLVLLLAAPAAGLLERRPTEGYALLMALQFFPMLAFLAYFISSLDGVSDLSYIADANFTGVSSGRFSWWSQARLVGLLPQVLAFWSLLFIAAARITPEGFSRAVAPENRTKLLLSKAAFALVLFLGLFAAVKIPSFAP